LQINRQYRVIQQGQSVLDLGAAPGGWMQAARQAVGTRGFVLGVDKQVIPSFPSSNVMTLVGDITQPGILEQIKAKEGMEVLTSFCLTLHLTSRESGR